MRSVGELRIKVGGGGEGEERRGEEGNMSGSVKING